MGDFVSDINKIDWKYNIGSKIKIGILNKKFSPKLWYRNLLKSSIQYAELLGRIECRSLYKDATNSGKQVKGLGMSSELQNIDTILVICGQYNSGDKSSRDNN